MMLVPSIQPQICHIFSKLKWQLQAVSGVCVWRGEGEAQAVAALSRGSKSGSVEGADALLPLHAWSSTLQTLPVIEIWILLIFFSLLNRRLCAVSVASLRCVLLQSGGCVMGTTGNGHQGGLLAGHSPDIADEEQRDYIQNFCVAVYHLQNAYIRIFFFSPLRRVVGSTGFARGLGDLGHMLSLPASCW